MAKRTEPNAVTHIDVVRPRDTDSRLRIRLKPHGGRAEELQVPAYLVHELAAQFMTIAARTTDPNRHWQQSARDLPTLDVEPYASTRPDENGHRLVLLRIGRFQILASMEDQALRRAASPEGLRPHLVEPNPFGED